MRPLTYFNTKWSMKANKMIFLLSMFALQSCGFIHYMGTKDIVQKNEFEVNKYLEQKNVSFYDYSFVLSKENIALLNSSEHVLDLWKYEKGVEQSTIQLRIYDSNGQLVNGYAQCYGDMNRINILSSENFKQFERFPNNYNLLFSNELNLFNLTQQQQQTILEQSSLKKYTFVIYWNIWSNHYSTVIFKHLDRYMNNYEMKQNSVIILANTDNHSNSISRTKN